MQKQEIIKNLIKKILPVKIQNFLRYKFQRKYKKSYSQAGEDLIINTILNTTSNGTYVDIGANNPFIQSNTYFFYKKGWNGINIDALPGSMKIFNKLRKRDLNLEIAISDKNEILKYYQFSSTFYNSFSEENAIKHKDKLTDTIEIITKRLDETLDLYLKDKEIDFMSIDVEGLDLNVLLSNNWERYRPKVIIVERFVYEYDITKPDPINDLLIKNGYSIISFTVTNTIYIENRYKSIRFGIRE